MEQGDASTGESGLGSRTTAANEVVPLEDANVATPSLGRGLRLLTFVRRSVLPAAGLEGPESVSSVVLGPSNSLIFVCAPWFEGASTMWNPRLPLGARGFSAGGLGKLDDVASRLVAGSDMVRGEIGLMFPTAGSLVSRRVGVVGGAVLGEEDWKESREGRVGLTLSGIGSRLVS